MEKLIPEGMNFLLLESLWCLPAAKKYKDANPGCKIVSIIADTTFLPERMTFARRMFYWLYLKSVDAFICESNRICKDAYEFMNHGSFMRPIYMQRPFISSVCKLKKDMSFNSNILFIGSASPEKGSVQAADAMKYLYGDKNGSGRFELLLVGDCGEALNPPKHSNVVACGRVPSLQEYFDKCTYYLHPSNFDACPTTVWEAMSVGLIPIITKDVGQAELFEGDLSILLLDSNDSEVIAKKIKEIESLSKDRKEKLRKACMRLASKYNAKYSIMEFRRLFRDIVAFW
jgi:glycosyltransferase involved in cell wall biosynthesis